ncbi:MAG: hydantoinase/oxoprolinase family protein [Acidimicrobiales bacterium]
MRERVGVDVGGTFTDLVNPDGSIAKVLSTPDDPARAVLDAINAGGPAAQVAHGTTLASNILLAGQGAPVALYVSEVRSPRIRTEPGDGSSAADPLDALVPRGLRFEVAGRMTARGQEIEPLGPVPHPPAGVAAAVALRNAGANPKHEHALAAVLRGLDVRVSESSEVSPDAAEYEAAISAVVNASLLAPCGPSLLRLAGAAEEVLVMGAAGGLIALEEAVTRPAALVYSSQTAGVVAACAAAKAAGCPNAVTLDMGGTSTDVCLVLDGQPATASPRQVAGLPLALAGIDVHTIGAGGGSIARSGAGGAVVGPESSGADPGPACYGRGGLQATVTDANLVAGRLPAGISLPGLGRLDVDLAREALAAAAVTAEGILAAVNATMADAVRQVAADRGVETGSFALVAYGGAGPLHACELADALGIATVVIPARAGVLSAVGLLGAERRADVVQRWNDPTDYRSAEFGLASLAWVARSQFGPEGVSASVDQLFDCRYAGRRDVLPAVGIQAFHAEHQRRFGTTFRDTPIEVVALRASARQRSPISLADLPDPGGRAGEILGPAAIPEPDTTVWVGEGWQGTVGGGGAWILRRVAKP